MSVNRPGRRHWFANSGLKIRHLRVVTAVARTRNIGRAAQELHLTQPAVSKAVQQVEKAAGMPLFERRANGTHLTAAGSALVRYAYEIFGALERAGDEFDALSRGLGGTLSIGCNFPSATQLVPWAVVQLTRANPMLSVKVHEGPLDVLLPQLRSHAIDVVVGRWPRDSDTHDLEEHDEFEQPMVIVASPEHPLARAKKVTWSQLAGCDWILPPRGSAARSDVDELFRAKKIKPRCVRIESLSAYANSFLVRELGALSLIPAAVAKHLGGDRAFAILKVQMPAVFAPTSAITLRVTQTSPAVALFIQLLAQAMKNK